MLQRNAEGGLDLMLSDNIRSLLRCPACGSLVEPREESLLCADAKCGASYPVVDGVPVLINEQSSVFAIDDFVGHKNLFFDLSPKGKLKRALKRLKPGISANISGRRNYARLTELLLAECGSPRVLIVGGSILGIGMEPLATNPAIELVDTDVSFGPRTKLICDAHDIPFADESFDCVIVQAVLEHVADPCKCVSEFWRVLKPNGFAYSETAFMQPVHGGRFDFTRFTHLGHRRLFGAFEEIDSGAVCGPGMALALAWVNFIRSFARGKAARKIAGNLAEITAFGFKYFDYILINRPSALDCAAGVYFLGRKSDRSLSDRELIGLYRGAY